MTDKIINAVKAKANQLGLDYQFLFTAVKTIARDQLKSSTTSPAQTDSDIYSIFIANSIDRARRIKSQLAEESRVYLGNLKAKEILFKVEMKYPGESISAVIIRNCPNEIDIIRDFFSNLLYEKYDEWNSQL
jgi:hypothetical protein